MVRLEVYGQVERRLIRFVGLRPHCETPDKHRIMDEQRLEQKKHLFASQFEVSSMVPTFCNFNETQDSPTASYNTMARS